MMKKCAWLFLLFSIGASAQVYNPQSGAPSGAAGGSLTGTYPNPTVATIPSAATATTQSPSDNSTKVATTAYVATPGAISPTTVAVSGTATSTLKVGTSTAAAPGSATVLINGVSNGGIEVADNGTGAFLLNGSNGGFNFFTQTGAIGSETSTLRANIDSNGNFGIGGVGSTNALLDIFSVDANGNANAASYKVSGVATQFIVSANFTTAANTSLQTITGLSWTLPASTAQKVPFSCHMAYSQATANAAVAFGIQAATISPNQIFATGAQYTSATAATSGVLAALASTTATNIVSATPSATATNFVVDIDGEIDNPSNASTNAISIMVSTATSGDAVTVLKGSYCRLY